MAFPADYAAPRAVIQINASAVSGSSGALTQFPIQLVRANLLDGMCDPTTAAAAQVDGGDIRVSADEAGTSQIPIDVVAFGHDSSPGTGDARVEIWIKAPSVSKSENTQLYLWYGSSVTESQPGGAFSVEDVWSEYKAVYHFERSPGSIGDLPDSSFSNLDGTSSGSVTQPNPGEWTLGPGNTAEVNAASGWDINGPALTVMSRVRLVQGTTWQAIVGRPPFNGLHLWPFWQWGLLVSPTNGPLFHVAVSGGFRSYTGATLSSGVHTIVGTYDGSQLRVYVDGAVSPQVFGNAIGGGGIIDNDAPVFFGRNGGNGENWLGGILETRIRTGARDIDWIATEHATFASPETLLTVTAFDAGGSGALSTGSYRVSGTGSLETSVLGVLNVSAFGALGFGEPIAGGTGALQTGQYEITGLASQFDDAVGAMQAPGFSLSGQEIAANSGLGSLTHTGLNVAGVGNVALNGTGALAFTGLSMTGTDNEAAVIVPPRPNYRVPLTGPPQRLNTYTVLRELQQIVGDLMKGRRNGAGDLVLTPGTETIIDSPFFHASSVISLTPLNRDASTIEWWVLSRGAGRIVIGHTNAGGTEQFLWETTG